MSDGQFERVPIPNNRRPKGFWARVIQEVPTDSALRFPITCRPAVALSQAYRAAARARVKIHARIDGDNHIIIWRWQP